MVLGSATRSARAGLQRCRRRFGSSAVETDARIESQQACDDADCAEHRGALFEGDVRRARPSAASRATRTTWKERGTESLRTVEDQWLVRSGHEFPDTGPRGSRDDLQHTLATVGTAQRIDFGKWHGWRFARGCRSGRFCDTEQLPAQDQLFVADAVGQEAKAADADETAGEHMQHKASQELLRVRSSAVGGDHEA